MFFPYLSAGPCRSRLGAHRLDQDLGVGLTVTALLGPALLLLAEVDDLLVPALSDDLALDRRAADHRRTDLGRALTPEHQHVEVHLAANVALELLDLESIALGHAVLLAAGLDHRVHRTLLEILLG